MRIKFDNKSINVPDVRKCRGINKFLGLMFKSKDTNALLFNSSGSLHSFFCPEFLAVWLDKKNNVSECRLVKQYNPYLKPKKKFSKLLEIPVSKKYSKIIKIFLDERKI